MKLPNPELAVVHNSKLQEYCLNMSHPRGRHKARVFASALGITQQNADVLRRALLAAVIEMEANLGLRDEYGQRYMLDFEMFGPNGKQTVRSLWVVLHKEGFPRLTSCYVL